MYLGKLVDFRSERTVGKVTVQSFPDAFRGAGVKSPRRKKMSAPKRWGFSVAKAVLRDGSSCGG